MAMYYARPRTQYLWIRFTDPATGKQVRKSTCDIIRPDGVITPCPNNKEGIAMAKKICAELESLLLLKYDAPMYFGKRQKISTINETIEHFLSNNNSKNKNTITEYKTFFKKLKIYYSGESPVTEIDKLSSERYLASLRNATYEKQGRLVKYSENSLYAQQKIFKKYISFLAEYKYIPDFKISSDVKYRQQVKPIKIFTTVHLEKIFLGLNKKNTNFRTAILMLLYTGLRPSDILTISVSDIDLSKKSLQYYSPKLKQYRRVPIREELIPELRERINVVKAGKLLEYADAKHIGRAFNRYIESLGICGYNLRTFRKHFVTCAYESGAEIYATARLLGHSPATAEKHYRAISQSKLNEELKKVEILPGLTLPTRQEP